jgi:hypothetical protein
MAYYLVQAKPIDNLLTELRQRLDSGEIKVMKPFGQALQYGLDNARLQENGIAIWEEEDYCVPPLAQERAAILDTYSKELHVEKVNQTDGWKKIESLPRLWKE